MAPEQALLPRPLAIIATSSERHGRYLAGEAEGAGFRVLLAGSGEEALQQATENPSELLLIEADMTGLSGVKVALCLRADAQTRELFVVFLFRRGRKSPTSPPCSSAARSAT